jgi:Flp pilus assembly protein TadG
MTRRDGGLPGERGQSLVEFSFALVIFLMLLMGIIDLGRAVYTLTGTAQAASEIARVTSVHPGATLGSSAETTNVVTVQSRLVPGLSVSSYECVDIAGSPIAGQCKPGYGYWVRVTIASTFHPVTPLALMFGPIQMTSHSSAEIE